MIPSERDEIIRFLGGFLTDARLERIDAILQRRTRQITVVLEDIFQPQNASAVIRTCDCFGIQDLHVIENLNSYTLNPDVTLGSSQWVDLHRYRRGDNNTAECLSKLKTEGYTLIATTPHNADCRVDEIIPDKKMALMFGTEADGLSPAAIEFADVKAFIPMEGFTESFNISVSAALCLYQLRTKLNAMEGWSLSAEEQAELKLQWYRRSIPKWKRLEEEYWKRKGVAGGR